jgi:hypothetical protein
MAMPDLEGLNDDELTERARKVHETLMRLPRTHASRDGYIVAWRNCVDEMNRRALPAYPPPHDDELAGRQPGFSGHAPGGFYRTAE